MVKIIIATVKAASGQEARLEGFLREIRDYARQNESGCREYKVVKKEKEGEFATWEVYDDDAAVQAHAEKNPGVQKLMAALEEGNLVEGQPQLLGPFEEI
ncbi:hypothetical protein JCM10213_006026 [Rhodosporidiobolus nylandii]